MTVYGGKYVWIVGASSGIGEALARYLAAQGATLILSATNAEKLAALRADLGERHHIWPLDVADALACDRAVEAVAMLCPRSDSVIFLAAIYHPSSLADFDLAMTRRTVEVNLLGAFNLLHAILPVLRRQRGGQIALCASVAGYRGLPNAQPYSATKAALINLAESLRAEEARHGIDVKLISPGFVRTGLTAKNRFSMPMMIEPDQAARAIADGLLSSRFEIHFPRTFTFLMKALALLPYRLYFALVARLTDR